MSLRDWLDEPQPVLRLEIVRILAPLSVLGFMSGRLAHAEEWIGDAGFHVPDLGHGDWRQPLYIPPLPDWLAWSVALTMIAAGLMTAVGYKTRKAAAVFASTLAFVALADRLAAFTVTKLSPVIMLVIALAPSGSRLSVDEMLARRDNPSYEPPDLVRGGVRFFQAFLPVMYAASGLAKSKGDWLHSSNVVWSHLHDSYQTSFSYWLAVTLPPICWSAFQWVTLGFEMGAPLWFALPRTRTPALVVGLGMHLMIALMFGPVRWFAFLMMAMLLGAYLPDSSLDWLARRFHLDKARRRKPRRKKKARPPKG